MKFILTEIGCDVGQERVVVEDEQLGEVTMKEIELEELQDIFALLDDVATVQFEETDWPRYDGEVTVTSGDLL